MVRGASLAKLDSVSFDKFLEERNPFADPSIAFDLSGIRLVTPAALVSLAAGCHALASSGQRATLVLGDEGVATYLLRTGFLETISSVTDIQGPLPPEMFHDYEQLRGSNPHLIEVTRLASGDALPDLLNQIIWVLVNRFQYPNPDAFDVATAISEICQNTFDHNRNTAGFISMQVYESAQQRFLEVGVADHGEGITASLARNPKNGAISSDLNAIELATKLGSSEHDDPTRGTGLHHLLEITFKHQGSVQIRSGTGKVRYRMDRRRAWAISVPPMPGVQIALNLPART